MTDISLVLILFIVCSSVKALYAYLEMGLGDYLLLIHVITTIGFSTIFVLWTIRRRSLIWFTAWYLLHTCYLLIPESVTRFC